jgi:hypothetical protein
MPGIVPQSEYYGLPERESRTLPPSEAVRDVLRPTGIPSGTMNTRKHASESCEYCGKPGHDWTVHPEAHRDVAEYEQERHRQEFPFGDYTEAPYPSDDDHDGSYWPGSRHAGFGDADRHNQRMLYGPGRDFGRDGGPANPPSYYEDDHEPSDHELDDESLDEAFEKERDPKRYQASHPQDEFDLEEWHCPGCHQPAFGEECGECGTSEEAARAHENSLEEYREHHYGKVAANCEDEGYDHSFWNGECDHCGAEDPGAEPPAVNTLPKGPGRHRESWEKDDSHHWR